MNDKKQKTKDAHGGAVAGLKAEDRLLRICKNHGKKLFKRIEEFEEAGLEVLGRNKFKKPLWWPEECRKTLKKGDESFFHADGFLDIGSGVIIELKSSNKQGTTEEKVMYDLEKIRDGVYGKDHKLIYAFVGDVCEDVGPYRLFEYKAKKEGLPVEIVFGWDKLDKLIGNL